MHDRLLGSLDKEEPELVDEFLRKMKDAVSEVHKTEGFPKGKIANARDLEDDWLTKITKGNAKMQADIKSNEVKESRKAIADS